jgi:hypothetical protein
MVGGGCGRGWGGVDLVDWWCWVVGYSVCLMQKKKNIYIYI